MVRADREWELGLSEMRKRAPIRLNMEIAKIYKQMIGHTIIGFEMEKDEEGNDRPVFTEEKKYQEMADILQTSVGALKASYHHAVKKIEQFIKGN